MSAQDPRQRSTIQVRASHFANKLSTILLRNPDKPDASTIPRSRRSIDILRKHFISASQPALAREDMGSEVSSDDSVHTDRLTRLPQTSHKKGLSMPVWSPPPPTDSASSRSLPSTQSPPGIVVTQHHSDSSPSSNPASMLPHPNPAVESPALIRTHSLTLGTPHTTGAGPTAVASCSVSPKALSSPAASSPSASSESTGSPTPTSLLFPPELSNNRRSPAPRLTNLPAVTIPLGSQPHITPSRREPLDKQGHGLRLSPAIIQRPPPWPIKNLPTISIQGQSGRPEDPLYRGLFPSRTLSSVPQTGGAGTSRGSSLSAFARRPSPTRLSTMPTLPMSGSERPQLHDETRSAYAAPRQCDSPENDPDLAYDMEDEMEEIEHQDYLGTPRSTSMDSTETELDGGSMRPRHSMDSIDESDMPENPNVRNRLGKVTSIPFSVESSGWGNTSVSTPPSQPEASSSASQSHALPAPTPNAGFPRREPGHVGFQSHCPDAYPRTLRHGESSARPADIASGIPEAPSTPAMPSKHRPPPLEAVDERRKVYRRPSRSMTNLNMPRPKTAPLPKSKLGVVPGSPPAEGKGKGREASPPRDAARPVERNKSVKRRQSMPSMNTMPPAYSPAHRQFPTPSQAQVLPRDEEGREPLPKYRNDILLIAQMPRKVEFTQPGVISRDRKWKRVWCVLEGTKFTVYKMKGVKSVWECVVGTGDGTVYKNNQGKGKDKDKGLEADLGRIRKVEEESRVLVEGGWRSSSREAGNAPTSPILLSPPSDSPPLTRSSSSNVSSRSSAAASESSQHPFTIPWKPYSHRHMSSTSSVSKAEPDRPDPSCLLREYTLQNAESGLGTDYTKRRNVIRVRMEGEQFLLQAKDVEDVVEWIEGLQAAANVALDLDERVMPRGPLFPRRRRRRRALADGSGPAPPAGEADHAAS